MVAPTNEHTLTERIPRPQSVEIHGESHDRDMKFRYVVATAVVAGLVVKDLVKIPLRKTEEFAQRAWEAMDVAVGDRAQHLHVRISERVNGVKGVFSMDTARLYKGNGPSPRELRRRKRLARAVVPVYGTPMLNRGDK